uniref:Interferon regulatory factor-3 domain-containing protein n=1 Tax=Meleagris gallopavo TaxID=9103 RepID=A0A803XK84_MELGA
MAPGMQVPPARLLCHSPVSHILWASPLRPLPPRSSSSAELWAVLRQIAVLGSGLGWLSSCCFWGSVFCSLFPAEKDEKDGRMQPTTSKDSQVSHPPPGGSWEGGTPNPLFLCLLPLPASSIHPGSPYLGSRGSRSWLRILHCLHCGYSYPQGHMAEESHRGTAGTCHMPTLPLLTAHPAERGYHVRGIFYGWSPTRSHLLPRAPSFLPAEDVNHSDCWLHIRLYYCDVLVKELTTRTAEGCRIASRAEGPYGTSCMEQIEFPPPRALGGGGWTVAVTEVLERLLPHLERGVLLWVAPEGVFMKRQCQGRVYWNGPLAPHRDWPNKLEREKTYKLLDTQQFLEELRRYLSHGQPAPQYQIHLCFGEEYPTSTGRHLQKLIMAHVEPVFARELFHHAQRLGPALLRGCPQLCTPAAPGRIAHVLQQLCQP